MICFKILWIFILQVNVISTNFSSNVTNSAEDCNEMLIDFSAAIANFTYCTVINAKPITMCEHCADSYFYITKTHNQLTKTVVNGTACIDNFINLDRLQIVNSVYKNANDLWNRAKCYECVTFINGTHEQTKVRKEFDTMFETFHNCTQKYINSTNSTYFCKKCMDDYVNLNNFYSSIGDITHGIEGLCMDIIDVMNKTQARWSKVCCQYRMKNESIYIITTVFMSIIPILFYILVKLFVDVKRPKLLPQNRFAESVNTPSTSFRRE